MSWYKISDLEKKAMKLGAEKLGKSTRAGKRFMVLYRKKWIHFGSATGQTFIDHKDKRKRKAWRARHSKIRLKDGRLAYRVKESPSHWAWSLLW
jgi:hypothetical protein